MIRFLRDLRLLPIAVVACACLFTLIVANLLLDDNSLVGGDKVVDADSGVIRTTPRWVATVAVDAVVGVADVQLSRRQWRGSRALRRVIARPTG